MAKPITAGSEVDSYCTKCKLDLNHRIIAMVGDTINLHAPRTDKWASTRGALRQPQQQLWPKDRPLLQVELVGQQQLLQRRNHRPTQ